MKILIAEDDLDVALQYKTILESRNHDVIIKQNGEDSLKAYHDALNRTKPTTEQDTPFDAVVLDYRMPKKDGLEVAKQILAINPRQRIIFASAYVKQTLADSVKQLKQVVELMQKPFELDALVDTIEDKEIYTELEKLNANVSQIKNSNPTHAQVRDLLEGLREIQKGRTF
ncbi:MAG: response regulator [Nitrososphaerales archaeon]